MCRKRNCNNSIGSPAPQAYTAIEARTISPMGRCIHRHQCRHAHFGRCMGLDSVHITFCSLHYYYYSGLFSPRQSEPPFFLPTFMRLLVSAQLHIRAEWHTMEYGMCSFKLVNRKQRKNKICEKQTEYKLARIRIKHTHTESPCCLFACALYVPVETIF